MRLCQTMIPGAILFTIGIFMFAALYLVVFILEDYNEYNLSLILTSIFNLGLQILFLWASLSFTFLIPDMRDQALNFLCGKPLKARVTKVAPKQDHNDIYFTQFQAMWKTNTR